MTTEEDWDAPDQGIVRWDWDGDTQSYIGRLRVPVEMPRIVVTEFRIHKTGDGLFAVFTGVSGDRIITPPQAMFMTCQEAERFVDARILEYRRFIDSGWYDR